MLKDQIQDISRQISADVIGHRRQLHANPELSFQEFQTSAYIGKALDALGIGWETMAGTGIVAMITGVLPSQQSVALRADIDALAITESNNVSYASTKKGVMHACGHDAHTASLLGTAIILQRLKDQFAGRVRLIFQPSEEVLPGGASQMIREGVLENPRPKFVIGQHVMPSIPAGKIGLRKGKFMASMDELYLTVYGKGGHGAQPHQNIDPVLIASHMIIALQQVVSRMANPFMPTVLSFGKLVATGTHNVIPDQVYLEGTFRTLDENWRGDAHLKIKSMAEMIADSMGGSCECRIVKGYPVLVNEENLTGSIRAAAAEFLGAENIIDLDIWMAAEDFAYYSQAADACFYLLGTGNQEKGITSSVHTPTFDIDEEALTLSPGLMAWLALRMLGN